MSSIRTQSTTSTYTGATASMQVDPEARHSRDAASESSSRAFPIESARCSTYPTATGWVPDRERAIIPDMMTALCRRCPSRQACLLWALTSHEQGYWAGTTTANRARMRDLGQQSVETADWLQTLAREEATNGALHPQGEGSYWWYRRRGCRCGECRTTNSAQRARERARAKARAVVAA